MFLINDSKQWFESIIRGRFKRERISSYQEKWRNNYFTKEMF